jgi:hypothetical protein
VRAWLLAFVFTQIVEVPIYVRGLRCRPHLAFCASALTHPIVWFGFFHPAVPGSHLVRVIAAELFAWLAEAAYFRLLGFRQAWWWSLVANASSLGAGLASRTLFGVP